MTTVNKSAYGRTNQLQPSVILERIRQGDEYNAAETRGKKQGVAKKYNMAPQDCHQRSKIAAMFGAQSRFNPHYVSRTPWKILDALSVRSAPEDIRNMLASLTLKAVRAISMGAEPSPASLAPDTQLIDTIMLNPEMYRLEIEILHAHMQSETAAGDISPAQIKLLEFDMPDLRAAVFGGREEAQAVAMATAYLREAMLDDTEIEMALPEQRGFLSQTPSATVEMHALLSTLLKESISGKIGELAKEIEVLRTDRAADEERRATWHKQMIRTLERTADIAESAELLRETAKAASDNIAAMIEELEK